MSDKAFSEEHLYAEHGDRMQSDMGDAQRLQWKRIADGLRRVIDASMSLSATEAELAAVAENVEALAAQITPLAVGRGIPLFGGGAESPADALSGGVPFSPVMGQLNAIAAPLILRQESNRVVGTVTLGATYQGVPGLVHGAIISALYDEVLALANSAAGSAGPTGRLTIHFRKPTPLDTPLRFEAWCEREDDRKVFAKGRCLAGDTLLTEAEGLFIRIRPRDQDGA